MVNHRLTPTIAVQFLQSNDLMEVREFTSISDVAAENLSKYLGDLYLSGLTRLSDAAAVSLGKHEGTLDLSGLTRICGRRFRITTHASFYRS